MLHLSYLEKAVILTKLNSQMPYLNKRDYKFVRIFAFKIANIKEFLTVSHIFFYEAYGCLYSNVFLVFFSKVW